MMSGSVKEFQTYTVRISDDASDIDESSQQALIISAPFSAVHSSIIFGI